MSRPVTSQSSGGVQRGGAAEISKATAGSKSLLDSSYKLPGRVSDAVLLGLTDRLTTSMLGRVSRTAARRSASAGGPRARAVGNANADASNISSATSTNPHALKLSTDSWIRQPYHSMQSLREWNGGVVTHFDPRQQLNVTYSEAYGWVQKMKELAFLSDLFQTIDADGSGFIDHDEFTLFATHPVTKKIFASRFGFQPHQKDKIIQAISGGKESISYESWMTFMYNLMRKASEIP